MLLHFRSEFHQPHLKKPNRTQPTSPPNKTQTLTKTNSRPKIGKKVASN